MVLSPRNPMARVCSHSPLISPAPRVPGGGDAQDQTFDSDAVPAHDATRFAERQESQDSRRPLSEKTIVAFAIFKHVPTSGSTSAQLQPGPIGRENSSWSATAPGLRYICTQVWSTRLWTDEGDRVNILAEADSAAELRDRLRPIADVDASA